MGRDRSFEIVWDSSAFFIHKAFGRHFSPGGGPSSGGQIQIVQSGPDNSIATGSSDAAPPNGFQVILRRIDTTQPRDYIRQRLDLNGNPVGPAELLGIKPQLLLGPGGDLYTTFYQAGLKGLGLQRMAPDGTPRGPGIVVSTRPIERVTATLARFANGDFLVGWVGLSEEPEPRQVLRARFVHQGVPVGQELDLNTVAGGLPGRPPHLGEPLLVTARSSQEFAAVWTVHDPAAGTSIHLRFFDPSGRPRGPEIVAVPSAKWVHFHSAALDDAGHLFLLWTPPTPGALRARLFSADTGAPLGGAYPLGRFGTYTCGEVAWAGDSWIVAYRATGDGRRGAIVWRRFKE
jgi:hypothetical protein